MAAGYKDFTAGATLAAADLEDYCQNQSVMRFADASTRDTALSAVKTEGMLAYLIDSNTLTVYSGSAWSTVGPVHGAGLTWTPAVVQSGSVSTTTTAAKYWRVGRLITGFCELAVTGTGTGANGVTVSTPVTASSSSAFVGTLAIFDTSATTFYTGAARLVSTTTIAGYANAQTLQLGAASFTAALASGDVVYVSFAYEAASDA